MTQVTDHKGNTYPSLKDMCDAYKISVNCFTKRLQRGATKREALTLPPDKNYYKYHGHIFVSKFGLLAYAGLNESEYCKIADQVKKI